MLRKLLLAALLAACTPSFAAVPLQGTLKGNTIQSSAFPVGSVTVDSAFTYVGTTSFVLYGVANCEIYLFADVDSNKQVRRYYWFQFEGFLADNDRLYNYSRDPEGTMLGGKAFHERSWFFDHLNGTKNQRPGSDVEAVQKLFAEKGLILGSDAASIRLVRLDESKRKEFMIIYSENLPASLTAPELRKGGKDEAKAAEVIDALKKHAVAGLKMDM